MCNPLMSHSSTGFGSRPSANEKFRVSSWPKRSMAAAFEVACLATVMGPRPLDILTPNPSPATELRFCVCACASPSRDAATSLILRRATTSSRPFGHLSSGTMRAGGLTEHAGHVRVITPVHVSQIRLKCHQQQ